MAHVVGHEGDAACPPRAAPRPPRWPAAWARRRPRRSRRGRAAGGRSGGASGESGTATGLSLRAVRPSRRSSPSSWPPRSSLAGCGGGDDDKKTESTATARSRRRHAQTDTAPAQAAGCEKVPTPKPKPRGQAEQADDQARSEQDLHADGRHQLRRRSTSPSTSSRRRRPAASFASLADKKFYDGTIFHRISRASSIQGGDPTGDGQGGPGYKVVEAPPSDIKYTHGRRGDGQDRDRGRRAPRAASSSWSPGPTPALPPDTRCSGRSRRGWTSFRRSTPSRPVRRTSRWIPS